MEEVKGFKMAEKEDNQITEDQQRKFDSYLKLTEIHTMRWNERRKVNLRFSYALWVLLLSAAATVQTVEQPHVLSSALIIVVLVHFFFLSLRVWQSNQQDIGNAFYYHREAEKLLNTDIDDKERFENKPDICEGLLDWWVWLDTTVTAFFALATYYAIMHINLAAIILDKT